MQKITKINNHFEIFQMNYFFLKEQLNKTPAVQMEQESFERILDKVQDQYENKPNLNKIVQEVFADTKNMFYEAMQKSLIQSVLIPPNVYGLEEEYLNSLAKETE